MDSHFPFSESAINEHLFRLALDSKGADARYVFHFLLSANGQRQILSDFRGATVGGIGRSFIHRVQVPLPQLEEQRRISAILDEADAIRRKQQTSLQYLARLSEALFAEMFGEPQANPLRWPTAQLGCAVKVIGGFAFRSQDFSDSGAAVVRISNLKDGKLDLKGQ